MNENENLVPKRRFKEFTNTGTWEQRKLGDMVEFFSGLTYSPDNVIKQPGTLVLRSSNVQNGEIVNADNVYVDNEVVNSDNVQVGDIAVVVRNGSRSLIGKHAAIKYPMKDTVIGAFMTGVRSDTPSFTNALLDTQQFETEIAKNLGATINQITTGNFKKMIFNFPEIDERLRIGDFFNQLDNTIALHQRQLDNCKALKKVMLQKIFNQELRFKDQEGNNYPDWEKIALNELGETYTGLSGKTKEDFGKGKGRFVTYMNVYSNPIADLAMTENVEIKDGENQNEVCYGDIFFTTSSETPEEVGMSSVWLSHESKVYLNSFCFGYRLSSRSEGVISPDFLGFQLRAPHIRKKIIFLAQGSTRFNISKSKLMDIVVYMPTIEEQNKITAFLLNVDSRIKHTIQSIERLNMLKKALLQQMFI